MAALGVTAPPPMPAVKLRHELARRGGQDRHPGAAPHRGRRGARKQRRAGRRRVHTPLRTVPAARPGRPRRRPGVPALARTRPSDGEGVARSGSPVAVPHRGRADRRLTLRALRGGRTPRRRRPGDDAGLPRRVPRGTGRGGTREVQLLQEWLAEVFRSRPRMPLSKVRTYALLPHCTERAVATDAVAMWTEVFRACGLGLEDLRGGCCGMGGTFGICHPVHAHHGTLASTTDRFQSPRWTTISDGMSLPTPAIRPEPRGRETSQDPSPDASRRSDAHGGEPLPRDPGRARPVVAASVPGRTLADRGRLRQLSKRWLPDEPRGLRARRRRAGRALDGLAPPRAPAARPSPHASRGTSNEENDGGKRVARFPGIRHQQRRSEEQSSTSRSTSCSALK